MPDLLKGTCKWFNSKKGFGFITLDGGEEVFVHQSEIYASGFRSLGEGERIECEVITLDDSGKKKAVSVTGPNGGFVQGDTRRMYQGTGGYRNGGGDRYGDDRYGGERYGSGGERYGGGGERYGSGGERYGGGGERYGGGGERYGGGGGRYAAGGDRYAAGADRYSGGGGDRYSGGSRYG